MTEPNVMPSSMIWRDPGTRPNSSVLAQPSAVVRTLVANLDPNATSAARNAMCSAFVASGFDRDVSAQTGVAAISRRARGDAGGTSVGLAELAGEDGRDLPRVGGAVVGVAVVHEDVRILRLLGDRAYLRRPLLELLAPVQV